MPVYGDESATHAHMETAMREPERLLNVMNRPFHKRFGH
jgi:hypothetical protein